MIAICGFRLFISRGAARAVVFVVVGYVQLGAFRAAEAVGDAPPSISVLPGAGIEFPGALRVQRGGVSAPLPPNNGVVRAQPGGNIEIQPLGDYFRGALDIYPTAGKQPDMDALAELTIHRIHPTNLGHEMLSISGLAHRQNRFGVIVEAHGHGRIKPLDFMMIQGGLLSVDRDVEPFDAVAMRVTTEGTVQFSAHRRGGKPGPVDAVVVERDNAAEESPSDFVRLTARRRGAGGQARSDWRTNVTPAGESASALVLANREQAADYQDRAVFHSNGDVELKTPGAGVILPSPNGARWRLTVSDDGQLKVDPADPR